MPLDDASSSTDDTSSEAGDDASSGPADDASESADGAGESTDDTGESMEDTGESMEDTSEAQPEDAGESMEDSSGAEEDAGGAGPGDTMSPPADDTAEPEPSEGEFSEHFSIIDSLSIADGDCCFDFDNDGSPDNGLGGLLSTITGLLGDGLDINASIADAIAEGSLSVLYEQVGLDDDMNDELTLNGYVGVNNGDGTYAIDPESIDEETGEPVLSFGAEIVDGVISTEPADFFLAVPLDDLAFAFTLTQTEMVGEVSMAEDGNGLDWVNGQLGGVVSLEEFVNAFNAIGDSCECMGLDGAPLFTMDGENKIACSSAAQSISASACSAADGDLCEGIASNAGLACLGIGLIVSPDIDSDENGIADSFSVGVNFTGVSAEVTGLAE
jgi:hypothetical protein